MATSRSALTSSSDVPDGDPVAVEVVAGHLDTLRALAEAGQLWKTDGAACWDLLDEIERGGPTSVEVHAQVSLLRGEVLRQQGDYFAALAQIRASQQAWLAVGHQTGPVRASLVRAAVLVDLGDFEEATTVTKASVDALGLLVPTMDSIAEVSHLHAAAHYLRGLTKAGLGDSDHGMRNLDLAANLYQSLGDSHGLGLVCMSRGRALSGLGLRHRGLEELRRAHGLLALHGSTRETARCLVYVAEAYRATGEVTRAIDLLRLVESDLDLPDVSPELGSLHLAMGSALLAAGLPTDAHERVGAASQVFNRLAMRHEAGQAALLGARASVKSGHTDTATNELAAAERLFAECGSVRWQARVWLTQAELADRVGDKTSAELLADRVLSSPEGEGPSDTAVRTRLLLAGLSAETDAEAHLAVASSAAVMLGAPALSLAAGVVRARNHRTAGRLAAAVTELRRVQQYALSAEQVDPDPMVRIAVRARMGSASDELIETLLEQGTHQSQVEAWQWVSASKAAVLNGLAEPSEGWHPDPPPTVSSVTLADLLEPGRVGGAVRAGSTYPELPPVPERPLLEYYVLGQDVIAFVVRDGQVHVQRLRGAASPSRRLVRAWQRDCFVMSASRGATDLADLAADSRADTLLADLYAVLVEPVAELIDDADEQFLVVAHEHLHSVPFDALVGRDGGYLGERLRLSFAPGLSRVAAQRRVRRERRDGALVLAVPDTNAPLTLAEAALVGELLPDAQIHVGSEATSELLASRVGDAGIVHLACHGTFRSENPLFSSLRLGDRWVTAREIIDLDLDGALVVLSACSSGQGSARDHEPIGLAWACLAAGAEGVVAAMWMVDDAVTLAFMHEFYRHLNRGVGPREAMGSARALIARTHPHPYFWAPFRYFSRPRLGRGRALAGPAGAGSDSERTVPAPLDQTRTLLHQ